MGRALAAACLCLLLTGCGAMGVSPSPRTVQIGESGLAYIEKGNGPPIVLVHGALGDYRSWKPQLDAFSQAYRVIATSLRGHYPNPLPADDAYIGIPAQTRDLIASLDALRLGPVHLVGHSRGAAPALLAALQRPDLIRTLVVADAPMFSLASTDPQVKAWIDEIDTVVRPETAALLQKGQAEQAMRRYFAHFYGPGGFERLSSETQAEKLENVRTLAPLVTSAANPPGSFTCDHAKRIGSPTLLLGGELSPRAWKLTLDELAKCMPNAQRVTIAGGHGLPMENPQGFNREVLRFLQRR